MTTPINLTELRVRVELYEDNLALKDTLLALIDTAEAANAWYADMGDNSKTSHNYKALRETLTRYTTS